MSIILRPGEFRALLLPAGAELSVSLMQDGAGAAMLGWAAGDTFEQVSDAYTFMELRRTHPRAGDALFSTLRRPMLVLRRDDMAPGVDLLRHDAWLSRTAIVGPAAAAVKKAGLTSPGLADFPFAINLFAHTTVLPDGVLQPEPALGKLGCGIVLAAAVTVILVFGAMGDAQSDAVSLSSQWPATSPLDEL